MKKLIIFGTGSFAEVAHFYFSNDSDYEVVGFTVDSNHLKEKKLFDLPIIPFENIESSFPPTSFSIFVAIGYTQMNKIRENICDEFKNKGYELASYVNSRATTWKDLNIGENCFILENNVIQPFVKIGNNVIIWSGNHIGHHTLIDSNCFITSHVVISGQVHVKQNCFLGVNSTIRDGVIIESECIIGAGSVILKDTKQKEVYTPQNTKLLPIKSDQLKHL
jgi:sugar O-acyltransferase (sialic acid O-acetyltransferase NeuD family)